jgi:hypothetical protein
MNARKAHRRWIAWQRYQHKTQSRPSNWRLGGTHRGMVFAHAGDMFAGRAYPHGPRRTYMFRTTWEYR